MHLAWVRITLSYLPYAVRLYVQAKTARRRGAWDIYPIHQNRPQIWEHSSIEVQSEIGQTHMWAYTAWIQWQVTNLVREKFTKRSNIDMKTCSLKTSMATQQERRPSVMGLIHDNQAAVKIADAPYPGWCFIHGSGVALLSHSLTKDSQNPNLSQCGLDIAIRTTFGCAP